MVEALDQVFRTFFSFLLLSSSMRLRSSGAAKGPFLMLLLMFDPPYLLLRRLTMNLLVGFFVLRVLRPMAGLPQGVTGPGRPTGLLPSPPPWGWSLGFITEPRTVGRMPMWRFRPALPMWTFSWSRLPTWPMTAVQ